MSKNSSLASPMAVRKRTQADEDRSEAERRGGAEQHDRIQHRRGEQERHPGRHWQTLRVEAPRDGYHAALADRKDEAEAGAEHRGEVAVARDHARQHAAAYV